MNDDEYVDMDFMECDYCGEDSNFCDCSKAASCVCGAWVFAASGKAICVADCCCGAE